MLVTKNTDSQNTPFELELIVCLLKGANSSTVRVQTVKRHYIQIFQAHLRAT